MQHDSYVVRTGLICRATENVALPGVSTCRATLLNPCDTSTSVCDKVRPTRVWRQNHVLCQILNIARLDTQFNIFPLKVYYNAF